MWHQKFFSLKIVLFKLITIPFSNIYYHKLGNQLNFLFFKFGECIFELNFKTKINLLEEKYDIKILMLNKYNNNLEN